MAFYESIYILRPDLTTEQVESINQRIAEIVESSGGKVLETELWGRRQLAYAIKKTSKGYYVFHVLEGSGPLITNMESWMRINEDVLKYQNIRIRKPKTTPSPLAPFEERPAEGDTEGTPSEEREGEETEDMEEAEPPETLES